MKTRGLVVFDVDGTLVDSQYTIIAAMNGAFAAMGMAAPSAHAVRRVIGLSLPDAVAVLAPELDQETCRSVAYQYKDSISALRRIPRHEDPLFPGAIDVMDALGDQGWLLGVATGNSRRGLDMIIERHGLQKYFVTLQTADDNPSKPSPDMLYRALDEANVSPELSVMVGDATYDMMMGRRAGVRCIGVGWGNCSPEELRDSGADVIIEDFSELPVSVMSERNRCVSPSF